MTFFFFERAPAAGIVVQVEHLLFNRTLYFQLSGTYKRGEGRSNVMLMNDRMK